MLCYNDSYTATGGLILLSHGTLNLFYSYFIIINYVFLDTENYIVRYKTVECIHIVTVLVLDLNSGIVYCRIIMQPSADGDVINKNSFAIGIRTASCYKNVSFRI